MNLIDDWPPDAPGVDMCASHEILPTLFQYPPEVSFG
jgi:hypothetical protein